MLHGSSCPSSLSDARSFHGALAPDLPLDVSQAGPTPANECANIDTGVPVP